MLKATLVITDEAVSVSYVNADSVTLSITQGASLWEADGADKIKPKGAKTVGALYLDLSGKVDVVEGKELSDNNYTDTDKIKVDKLIIDGDGTKFLGDDGLYVEIDTSTIIADLSNKVDKVTGKELSTNDFTDDLETKLNGIEAGANAYTHPANHSPSIITQDASNRFVTDTEKGKWNTRAIAFYVDGTLTVDTKLCSIIAPFAMTITEIRIAVDTAPTGADLIVDVNKNGTTLYTTQGNRPTITATNTSATATDPDVTAIAVGDKISIDVDQVGSIVAGENLAVTIICEV